MTIIKKQTRLCVCLLLASTYGYAFTNNYSPDDEIQDKESVQEALTEGVFGVDLRLRYEDVNESLNSADRGAQALTLRSNVRYETARYNLFTGAVGLQDVRAIPDDSSYFSGENNELDDALVADPEITRVNEAWLAYDIINTLIKYGRQDLEWNNGRFVGNEGWRQLGQSFTGLTLKNEYLNYVRFRYAQLNRVENYFGEDADIGEQSLDAKLINLEYQGILNSFLSLYHYDIDNQNGYDSWDSKTYGLRFSGRVVNEPTIEYAFEAAKQKDAHDNPADYSASYYLYELGVTYQGVRFFGGKEVLGAEENGFLVAPLGSKHNFQGFSDQFDNNLLGNITGGISDSYFSLGYLFSEDASIIVSHHDYQSDHDGVGLGSLGSEWNIEARFACQDYSLVIKYSDYDAENLGVDTEKMALAANYRF